MTAELQETQNHIQSRIFTVRGIQVMLDRDLAEFYGVETKVLNQAVKRNIERFPEHFMFQLTEQELKEMSLEMRLRSQIVTSNRGGVRYRPYVFTEQGVSQLSAVLRSKVAVMVSIRIIDAFVAMRNFLSANAGMFQRIETLERHQIETDRKIDYMLDCLEEGSMKEKARIFSAGQVYDAKAFIAELIGRATKRIILIDGYINATTINLLDARTDGIAAKIYTYSVGESLKTLCEEYIHQYPTKPLSIEKWKTEQHDRWLIIDKELWHCGASIKDAGLKSFGIDPIGLNVDIVLSQV